nr:MAG TPA: hypothetical protein [Caudoviricetes sp.]
MSTNTNGFDELIDSLKKLEDNVHRLEGTNTVSFDKLFTKTFMEKHTGCSSFDEFLKAGNFVVNSKEDFEAIPDEVFDKYVSSATNFDSWDDMLNQATNDYLSSELSL